MQNAPRTMRSLFDAASGTRTEAKTQALSWLGRALRMDASYRQLIDDESDFDPLRHDPDFQMIVSAVQQAE